MIFRWAGYLLLIIFSAYEAVVFDSIFVSMLFVAVLLWPVVMMIGLFVQRRHLKMEMKVPVPVAEKNGHIQIQIAVSQEGWAPVSQVSARLACTSLFTGKKEVYPLVLSADGHRTYQYVYELSRHECGKVRVEIDKLCLWDYFHFFSVGRKFSQSVEVTFLPQIYETAVTVCEATRHFAGETEDYEPEAAGPDNSQIYQIREYRPGDRLQMIHWKLTARNDELFVKESSEPVCFSTGIFMDLLKDTQSSQESMEAMIETVLSISNGLLEQKCRHFIVWYDEKEDRLIKRKIGRMEDLYETTEYLMSVRHYNHPVDLPAMYKERYPYGLYAVALHVDLKGNISKNDEIIGMYQADDIEKSLSGLLIQV